MPNSQLLLRTGYTAMATLPTKIALASRDSQRASALRALIPHVDAPKTCEGRNLWANRSMMPLLAMPLIRSRTSEELTQSDVANAINDKAALTIRKLWQRLVCSILRCRQSLRNLSLLTRLKLWPEWSPSTSLELAHPCRPLLSSLSKCRLRLVL